MGLFFANRIMLFFEIYGTIYREFEDDSNFYAQHCTVTEKRQQLGRRMYLCQEIKTRLSYPIITHSLDQLVKETFYREMNTKEIIQGIIFIVVLYTVDRFFPGENNQRIPMFIQHMPSIN